MKENVYILYKLTVYNKNCYMGCYDATKDWELEYISKSYDECIDMYWKDYPTNGIVEEGFHFEECKAIDIDGEVYHTDWIDSAPVNRTWFYEKSHEAYRKRAEYQKEQQNLIVKLHEELVEKKRKEEYEKLKAIYEKSN